MQTFSIDYKFKIGEVVGCNRKGMAGEIANRWAKIIRIGDEIRVQISYTLLPEKPSYNQWRSSEEELNPLG